jgi:hypothetical protein
MIVKLRYGYVVDCFERVVKCDGTKGGGIVYSQSLCSVTLPVRQCKHYISFPLAKVIVLFCRFFCGAVDTPVCLTSGWLIDDLKKKRS